MTRQKKQITKTEAEMEILTTIKTPINFNAAEEEILENPEFMKLQQDHKFGDCAADNSDLYDFWLENADGFIKIIF